MPIPLDSIVKSLEGFKEEINKDMSLEYLTLYNDPEQLEAAFNGLYSQVDNTYQLLAPEQYRHKPNFLVSMLADARRALKDKYGYTEKDLTEVKLVEALDLMCRRVQIHIDEKRDVLHKMEAIETCLMAKLKKDPYQRDIYLLDRHDIYKRLASIVPESDINAIKTLSQTSMANHQYTAGHGARVMYVGMGFLDWMYERLGSLFVPRGEFINARDGFLLHDIGKTARSRSVLDAARKLTDEEWDDVRLHPVEGGAIIENIPALQEEIDIVRHHHERWDGKGYPDKLHEDQIPVLARVCALADVYDAMTSKREYRNQLTTEQAAKEIKDNAGTQFDPELAEFFYQYLAENDFDGDKVLGDNETKWIDLEAQGII